ncbi:TPA_exp: putative Nonsense-mediated mRNA decay protein Upf3 [Trichophyton benhamiae CBS 112371]|uniref:Nonsense-mediated mRNA decay protein Upf3, putative n=1 Tax=Arthroderma benhamiae (strain ATCC MYA-4681 / CBS 112371) TaxID=663331 RepID=D4AZW4_ARTBC|nr:nonsense-mediated mRNA decay protein Upf3, putative [Trichophyton benhamiae CBS 112371]EFE31339.1 nonsense-mediated mRNA decay protein Upf3, putative [Trichophyton benhamiae CBS 112371]DAA74510.1 TPA_exp: putative Nonsense-mediated mRNA decay protein Upf3 [Trichophyton benhamiae CBS 112371]
MSQKNQQKASPGVLAINPAATQKAAPPPTPKGHSSKGNAPRLKLHVRRLPPGLTQAEFETTLGDFWKVGRGKVDWFLFKEGKVSTDPSKPSRPGRAYLRVTSSVTIPELSDVIRQTTFHDARNTYNDSALLGPPTLEYAPFSRVPSGKVRNDARVGTIDQDAEFIAFLESLTNPVTKPSEEETTEAADKVEKPTITPLIQYLREKKANKAKEVAAAKAAKQARSAAAKESKSEKSIGKKQLLSRADKSTSEKQKKDKAAKDVAVKDAVKAANKQAANGSTKAENKALASSVNQPPQASPAPERKRERGSLTAATKILRRDLGLTTPTRRRDKAGQASSSGSGGNATADSAKKDQQPSNSKSESNNPAPSPKGKNAADSTPKSAPSKQSKGTPPAEPAARNNAAGKKAATTPSTPNTKASSNPAAQKNQQQSSQSPSSNGTQAFLKHANPSQGVTEDLLQKGFSQFGKVIRVEIDKKKGFGYVDFAEPASLRKAIDASPVSIAQSQVVVLERRTSAAVAQNRGHGNRGAGAGGGSGGGGGQGPAHANTQQQPSQQGSRPAQAGSSPTAAAAPPPTTSPASRGTPGPRGRGTRRGYGRGGAGGRGK